MCEALSAVVTRKKVYWKFAIDSHEDIKEYYKLKDVYDRTGEPKLCPIGITPKNKDYLNPDEWIFKFDNKYPSWWKESHENMCWDIHKEWLEQLNKILIKKNIIHPFEVKPPSKITKKHILLLKQWNSVWNSVRNSVGNSVWYSVSNSLGNSVGNSVWNSVRNSVGNSVWYSVSNSLGNSVWNFMCGYIGSFFKLNKWENIKHKKGEYPFQSSVDLWEFGLVSSFDGTTWRLHGNKNADILFEITKEDLEEYDR